MEESPVTTSKNADGAFEPFSAEDVPCDEWTRGTRFGLRTRALGAYGGGTRVGVNLEELAPGRQAWPNHYHLVEEEHLYLLEGTLELKLGERLYTLQAGSYVCFPAGQAAGHSIRNPGPGVARYLMIGENHPHDVAVYPESGRVGITLLRKGYKEADTMPYWEGESGA